MIEKENQRTEERTKGFVSYIKNRLQTDELITHDTTYDWSLIYKKELEKSNITSNIFAVHNGYASMLIQRSKIKCNE